MGLGEWFEQFHRNLRVSNSDSISYRYKAITKRLNTDFWDTTSETAHSLYVGSYGRNTAINGISDIDMVFELPTGLYAQYNNYLYNGQSALLQAVKSSICKTYSSTDIGADGQVVVIYFSDGIKFEIVPVFWNTSNTYTYPDSNNGGSWKVTNPRAEISAIRDRNSACNCNLIPLCRMMRAWKSENNVDMGGLLIDTLAYQFIADWEYRDKSYLYYDYMCRDFFLYMANQERNQGYYRAPGSGSYVYNNGLFQYKARVAYNVSIEAIQQQVNGYEWSAKQKWRDIFGTTFPS